MACRCVSQASEAIGCGFLTWTLFAAFRSCVVLPKFLSWLGLSSCIPSCCHGRCRLGFRQ